MNGSNCTEMLDRLPDLAEGRLPETEAGVIESHLATCVACRAEYEMVQLLVAAGPTPVPTGLEGRLQDAVRRKFAPAGSASRRRSARRVPAWGLAAAAGLVLAVATPVLVQRMGSVPGPVADDAEMAAELGDRLPSPWIGDEAMLAGAPMLDGLSDEMLAELLKELGG